MLIDLGQKNKSCQMLTAFILPLRFFNDQIQNLTPEIKPKHSKFKTASIPSNYD